MAPGGVSNAKVVSRVLDYLLGAACNNAGSSDLSTRRTGIAHPDDVRCVRRHRLHNYAVDVSS